MPADSHTATTSDLESTAISFEPFKILFEPETLELMFPLESWIAWFFARFDTAKERLKGFVEILYDSLQHMAVDRTSVGIGGFVRLDLTQLFILADAALFLTISVCALRKTTVVPMTTGL
jgi:hypothetical protein